MTLKYAQGHWQLSTWEPEWLSAIFNFSRKTRLKFLKFPNVVCDSFLRLHIRLWIFFSFFFFVLVWASSLFTIKLSWVDNVIIRCRNRCSLRLYYKNYVIFAINREKRQNHFWPSAFRTSTPAIALYLLYFFPRCCWLRARYVYCVIYAPDRAIARARQGYVEDVAPSIGVLFKAPNRSIDGSPLWTVGLLLSVA